MKVSYNWLQEYLSFQLPAVDVLAEAIGSQLGAVESVDDLGGKYSQVVAVRITNCEPIADSDHLNLCLIDDGRVVPDVERNDDGLVQVVCGAPNARAGIMVAWLPPGSTVPSTLAHEPFVLGSRALRGHISHGMLASQKELGLGDNHSGILEIDVDCAPGAKFADLYKLDDYIIDIENKMFTHRPDCFGIIGVAREIAGILGQQFNEPEWYLRLNNDLASSYQNLPLVVRNDSPDLVSRFMAVAISGVTVGASSVYLQSLLQRVGIRSINNIVDITNYFMHLTGQPLHAYDYDKVMALSDDRAATLIARLVEPGEKLVLLNGKEIEPREGAIVIANNNQLIGLAGVMGGASTEVDDSTENIILEAATFDMYSIRRTSMVHGLFSEAVTRFNKGQSPYQNDRVLVQAASSLCETGAKLPSNLNDESNSTYDSSQTHFESVTINLEFINARLGSSLSTDDIAVLLSNVGFKVEHSSDNETINISVPFWRTDIAIEEDIVEEVGRLYGFDKLELVLPQRSIAPATQNDLLKLKSDIRRILSRAGANEVLTYSFVHGNLLDKVGQDRQASYKLSNALSPDLQYYRQSLTPSLLDKINLNIRSGFDQFALFELGKGHIVGSDIKLAKGVPAAFDKLSLVFACDLKTARQYDGAPFYQAKHYLSSLLDELGILDEVEFAQYDPAEYIGSTLAKTCQYELGRTATIRVGDVCLGEIGEYKKAVRQLLKLPDYCAGFELDTSVLLNYLKKSSAYRALPKFPKSTQDLCLRVPDSVCYADTLTIANNILVNKYGSTAIYSISPVDIFQRAEDTDYKQITLRISLNSYLKTLTDDELSAVLNEIAKVALVKLGAERV